MMQMLLIHHDTQKSKNKLSRFLNQIRKFSAKIPTTFFGPIAKSKTSFYVSFLTLLKCMLIILYSLGMNGPIRDVITHSVILRQTKEGSFKRNGAFYNSMYRTVRIDSMPFPNPH